MFSESSLAVSWELSNVDCLSAFKDVRDGTGSRCCFLDTSAELAAEAPSGIGVDSTGAGAVPEDSNELDVGDASVPVT